ncbi:site-specific integrase [Chitinophaga alhagiae]|uniref:site-specific integrase n=1 Tax=Chitinophaga alhagiae TaxID=2203219 RepID=UPI000E5C30F8|nr:site-specific integrase [Chitinophaga alhagiae]
MKVNEKLSILFLLEKSKISKDGRAPITIRLTIDGARAEISLGQKILPLYWNQEHENVDLDLHPDKKLAKQISQAVSKAQGELETHFFFLSQQYPEVTSELLKRSYTGELAKEIRCAKETPPSRTLLQVLNFKFSRFARLVKKGDRAETTLDRWKVVKGKIRAFLNFKFKKWDIPLTIIEESLSSDFLHFLQTEQGIQKNTAMKYLKQTKELLTIAENKRWLEKNPWCSFKTTYKQPDRCYLTLEQIFSISKKKLITRLNHVRNVFLFACFTGYSFNELLRLRRDMIFLGNDGKRWIKIQRQKTGNPECLPLLPIVAAIVDSYADDPYCTANDVLLPVKSYHNYNGYLKEIQDLCGIPFDLTTHVARHTFATTVCLDHGVPLETVSRLLGHTNIRTTQIYAKISTRNISMHMQRLEKVLFDMEGALRIVHLQDIVFLPNNEISVAV